MDIEDLDIDWNYVVERLDRIIDLSEDCLNRQLSDYAFSPALFRDFSVFRWIRQQDHGYLGLRLGFPAMAQTTYLELISYLARRRQLDIADDELQGIALLWLKEGRRCSGRTARQFIDDLSGRRSLAEQFPPR